MSTTLSQLLSRLDGIVEIRGIADPVVLGVTCDSRRVRAGDIFVALPGRKTDGREFIAAALEAGAVAVAAEGLAETGDAAIPLIQVKDATLALAALADLVHGSPSLDLKVAGVTGTNGKTTVAFLLQHLMRAAWVRAGLLGTVVYDNGLERVPADRTTPGADEIQSMLAAMRDNGCRGVAMEVSSHGLHQRRVASVAFDVGVFTNLTQDHLDYHHTMEAYYEAKKLLAEQMVHAKAMGGKNGCMVINADDPYGRRMAGEIGGRLRVLDYGFGARADYRVLKVDAGARGTRFALQAKGREFLVKTPLFGRFNIYNTVAALAAADALGLNFREAIRNMAQAPQVPGRMESVLENRPYRVFVDYAHTPDALANVLSTLRDLRPARLITVAGCGGDRDHGKRPQMGRIATEQSDFCIFTSDNPRSEDPETILSEMRAGAVGSRFQVIPDRAEAIIRAIQLARPQDIVLIAGKGHEDYQEIGGKRTPFDDRQVARRADRDRIHEEGGLA